MYASASITAILSAGLNLHYAVSSPLVSPPRGGILGNLNPARVVTYQPVGDSYAAGHGAGNAVNSGSGGCGRTDGSYPYQLNADADVVNQGAPRYKYNDLTCSGATTVDVLANQVGDPSFIQGASLYSVTAGGNDIGFGGIVQFCVYGDSLFPSITQDRCSSLLNNVTSSTSGTDTPFAQTLNNLYTALARANTAVGGQVVVVPYVRFYNTDSPTSLTCLLNSTQRTQLNDAVDQLNGLLVEVANAAHVSIVNPDDLNTDFNTHRFCDTGDQWLIDDIHVFLDQSGSESPAYPPTENGTLDGALTNPYTGSPLNPDTAATLSQQYGSGWGSITQIFHPSRDGQAAFEAALKNVVLSPLNSATINF
ncbi:MAG: hypothetical protein Q9175_002892 [Cornicularia normoerica]